jgi:RNA polymerase sigma factor (sigma-70 family)
MTPILLRTQTDARLLTLAAAGHDRAFETIVERYRKPLLRYLRRLLSEPLAEDVVQATFLNAWRALQAGSDVRELRPWLYRIGHNQAINALKRAGAALEPLPEGGAVALVDAGPQEEYERREETRSALEGVAALPDRQRAALLAIAVEGRAHADVAAELGLSDGAVRQLVHRARSSLRAVATAITPMPLAAAIGSSHEVTAAQVAELAAGAGSAGVAGFAMKAGAVAVTAGVVAAAGMPHHGASRPATPAAKAAVATAAPSASPRAAPASAPAVVAAPAPASKARSGTPSGHSTSAGRHRDRGTRSSTRHTKGSGGSSGHQDRSGHGAGGSGPPSSSSTGPRPVTTTTSDRRRGRSSDHGDGDDAVRTGDRHGGHGGGSDESGSTDDGGTRHGATSETSGKDTGGDSHDRAKGDAPGGGADDAPGGDDREAPRTDAAPAPTATTPTTTDDHSGGDGGGGGGDDGGSGGSGPEGSTTTTPPTVTTSP